jgi:hypothetical protein
MHHDQFIFSSSWLPSPRTELQTLAGYTISVKINLRIYHIKNVVTQKCIKNWWKFQHCISLYNLGANGCQSDARTLRYVAVEQ